MVFNSFMVVFIYVGVARVVGGFPYVAGDHLGGVCIETFHEVREDISVDCITTCMSSLFIGGVCRIGGACWEAYHPLEFSYIW